MTKYRIVPVEPTEEQWSGLARGLMMWLDMGDKTPKGLFKHLKMLGVEPPKWLLDEAEMQGSGVPSKGTRATLIYKAMLAAAPSPWISVEERLPEPGVDVLAFVGKGSYKRGVVTAGLFEGYGSITLEGGREGYGWASWETEERASGVVTHWMPLPEAPEKSE